MSEYVNAPPVEEEIDPSCPKESRASTGKASIAIGASIALAACGGGGGGSTPAPPAPPAPPQAPALPLPTKAQAARFLNQASMGATAASIEQLVSGGYEAWLDAQFQLPREISHWDWLVSAGYVDPANIPNQTGFDPLMWRQLIASPDQLRQRVGMALLSFLVVGIDGLDMPWRQFAAAAYVDVIWDGAFGNFRTLIEKVSTNVAMGHYLTFVGNRKANPNTGALPKKNNQEKRIHLSPMEIHTASR
jgi:uncharacterized protein (DUF1800 family)